MFTDLFVEAETDYRVRRLRSDANRYRLARSVPSREPRSTARRRSTRPVVIRPRRPDLTLQST